ncbi:MAG: endonuclease/exonuclease/phosphatase family protein [Deferrisomatales bacterium]|nr:endonuclease/exonuclease/phosphatase family protein [Deferrisomatales bacterium]
MDIRLATFNLENLGIRDGEDSPEARTRLSGHLSALRRVLRDLDADAVAFQECLQPELLDPLLDGLGYPHRVVSSPGGSPLRVGVCSRQPLGPAQEVARATDTSVADPTSGFCLQISGAFSRPVLKVPWQLPGLEIVLFVVHGKSKIPTPTPARPDPGAGPWPSLGEVSLGRLLTEVKRLAQAVELRRAVDAVLAADPETAVAVLGDFNDVLESEAVRCVLGDAGAVYSPHLESGGLYPCELELPAARRFTQVYRGRREMIDHLLVSRRLRQMLAGVEIHNAGLRDSGATAPGEGQFVGSDHAPLLAVFRT